MYKEINKCRISGSQNLVNILSLGNQYLTGVFPKSKEQKVTAGPIDLVWCPDSGLLQLKQSYELNEMYGDNYGYRSGLNKSMVDHLIQKISKLESLVGLKENDVVLDIGSNDATSLKAYSVGCKKIGIDPSAKKFSHFYPKDSILITDFFTYENYRSASPNAKAKIITSIAMFYDLEDPRSFVLDIERSLDDDGIWHFEQSYMPFMLSTGGYDTICHEHLEFYSLKVVKKLLEECGLEIIDVQTNSINGGSFAVTAAKRGNTIKRNQAVIDWMLMEEDYLELDSLKPYQKFAESVNQHRNRLKNLVENLVADGKTIIGYGASTKGNVLLQYCGFNSSLIPFICEVNTEKYGCYTPGTNIPIISENEAKALKPDYLLVLPWHFRENILFREREYSKLGGKLIFPFPQIEIY